MRLNTFDQVADWYNNIKPIRSKDHNLEDDIRPIGQRRYKWARIVKVNDDTYALTDGSWSEMSFNGSNPKQNEFIKHTAPILWERRPDGEYISIRGCMGSGYAIGRYQFYNRYLPSGLYHADNTRQGEHWIDAHGERYVLAKMGYRYDHTAKQITGYVDNSLVFKREGDKFVRVGELLIKGKHIDKARKAEVKPLLNKFSQWLSAVGPMLHTGYSVRHDYAKLLSDCGVCDAAWLAIHKDGFKADKVMEILRDEDHECRVALAGMCMYWMGVQECPTKHSGNHVRKQNDDGTWNWVFVEGRDYTEEETAAWHIKEAKRLKASYNRSMNKILDLFATETV